MHDVAADGRTVLFVSREPFRLALARTRGSGSGHDVKALVNVAW